MFVPLPVPAGVWPMYSSLRLRLRPPAYISASTSTSTCVYFRVYVYVCVHVHVYVHGLYLRLLRNKTGTRGNSQAPRPSTWANAWPVKKSEENTKKITWCP